MAVTLSAVLAISLCPATRSWAAGADSESPQPAMMLSAQVAEPIDLNAAWSKASSDYSQTFTITEGGIYSLSANLEAKSGLVINAPGQNVVLRLSGRKLTLDGIGASSRKTMLSITAADSVTIDGAATEGTSTIESAGESDVIGISSTAENCALSINDVAVKLKSKSPTQRMLSTHAVRIASGTLSLANCTLLMEMGNQQLRSDLLLMDKEPEVPSAVYAADGVKEAILRDCTVVGEGVPGFALEESGDTTSIGNAYALYSLAASTKVVGGSYKAVSLAGNATCLYGTALTVASSDEGSSKPLKLTADAGQLATGVLSTKAGSVVLDGPIEFTVDEDFEGYAQAEAALRSSVADGFVIGDCAPEAGTLPVLVMADGALEMANGDGCVIGSLSAEVASPRAAAAAAALTNALADGACDVAQSGSAITFRLNNAKAPARIGDTYYDTVPAAIAALADGQTLTILKDVKAISFARDIGATIDLNGHTASSLQTSGAAGGALTVRNGKLGPAETAVEHRSKAPLVLADVAITAAANDANAYGVYAAAQAGEVTISGSSTIDSAATWTSAPANAYGFCAPAKGPELVVDGASINASTASAGSSAYGIYTRGAATRIANAKVHATGATGTTYAAYACGALEAHASVFEAYVTGASGTVGGIGMGATSPASTTAVVDSCVIAVDSALDAGVYANANFACLIGSTVELTGTALPKQGLTLAGRNVFKSKSGVHMGMNLGAIALGEGFELGAGSDTDLVVSQAKKADGVGFSVFPDATAEQVDSFARMFSAKPGSFYEGWKLVGDAAGHRLVWRPASSSDGSGVVQVKSADAGAVAEFDSLEAALASAKSGDTVSLLADLSETGVQTISQNDLTLDLAGHALTIRAAAATAGALQYKGSGTLSVIGGTLSLEVGKSVETAAATYMGAAVTGGGRLAVAPDAKLCVDYAGGAATLAQYGIVMRGVSVSAGSLALEGSLEVQGARSDGAIGAMTVYGVFAQPGKDAQASVDVAADARVKVDGRTAASTAKNTFYAEGSSSVQVPVGMREIQVDPELDQEFYSDIVDAFRVSAAYDNPAGNTVSSNTHKVGIYYAQNVQIDHDGAWYDGIRLWLYSDVVAAADVGKMEAIVPAHIFTSTYYETLPSAYGIATGSGSLGTADVRVKGAVEIESAHGNAYALDAEGAPDGAVSWTCDGARLLATADGSAHPIAQGGMDLRNFIQFEPAQKEPVVYSIANTNHVRYEPAVARCVVVGQHAEFEIAGKTDLSADAADSASIEAASFTVGRGFALASPDRVCTIANAAGSNTPGAAFAKPAAGSALPSSAAALFADAYGLCAPDVVDGTAVWEDTAGPTVVFKAADAVVARYSRTDAIPLAAVSAAAARVDDQRQSYTVVGWSTSPDENAPSGYIDADGTVEPTEDAVYYAVYDTGFTTVPITFTNVFDSDGVLQADRAYRAVYGQTVGDVLDAAGAALPDPADYTDSKTGLSYRFAGWYPYSSAVAASPLLYSAEKLRDLEVTLAANGVSAGSGLVLRATYVAVQPGQHLVTFINDGFVSVCAVDDGARPDYTAANNANISYVSPSKQSTEAEAGKTYAFESWFVDEPEANGILDEGEQSYASILPRTYSDVTYTADWSWEWSDVTLTFYVKTYDEATGVFDNNAVRVFDTTYERKTQDIADSVVKCGSSFSYGGRVYTFEGWAVRLTDTEPVYDANKSLPSVTGDDRALSSAYAKSYYGVYSIADHTVDVTFYDGGTSLGTASVPATRTVAQAFAATKAFEPQDAANGNAFLGWATEAGATRAVDAVSTTVSSLLNGTAKELSLYAVYGAAPTYRVRLRTADGASTLYDIRVQRGSSVNDVLAKAGATVSVPAQKDSYFAGWYTAGGSCMSLADPVSGALDLFRTYRPITVSTADAGDITASVSSTSSALEGTSAAAFTIVPRTSADTPLRSTTASNSYSILKSYDIRLKATAADGTESVVTGDFGTATLKVLVGTAYKNSKVRAFWLGTKDGQEAVLNSSAKDVDADGYIAVTLGNYTVGDEDEGGNLAIAYIEGGASDGKISDEGKETGDLKKNDGEASGGKDSKKESGKESDEGSSGETDKDADDAAGGLVSRTGSVLSGSSLSGAALSGSGLASGLAKASDSAGSDGDGTAAVKAASLKKNEESAAAKAAAAKKAEKDAAGADGAQEDGAEDAGFAINVDLLVLVLIAAAVIALAARFIWRALAARRRRSDEDEVDELPSLTERYADGLPF